MLEEDDKQTHLLSHHPSSFDPSNEPIRRTGTVWTAIAHVITGVIGSGVLSLAWSVAQLGWIAGPLCLLVFGGVGVFVSNLLCDCYRSPDPEAGPTRNSSYCQAVKSYLGEKSKWACGVFIYEGFYGYGIAYTITAAISMRAIQKSNCYHDEGHNAKCEYGYSKYMLLFGAVQVVFSQIPDFHNMAWLSIVAAIMSVSYSSIGLGLGLAKTIGDGKIKGNITGVPGTTGIEKVWAVAEAVGDIAFAFAYNNILLEIEDTLKSPPPENQTMKKASASAILITTTFYFCCGCFGYAAFGDDTPGNLLTGFGFYEPYWLIDFANACVVLHLVGGYQIYSQPVFTIVEGWITKKLPDNAFVNNVYSIDLRVVPVFKLNLLRIFFRTAYVASTTVIAIIFPYFNDVIGVLGALNYWPLAIYFPVEMCFLQRKIRAWTSTWVLFQVFRLVCLVVTVVALIGSLEELLASTLS